VTNVFRFNSCSHSAPAIAVRSESRGTARYRYAKNRASRQCCSHCTGCTGCGLQTCNTGAVHKCLTGRAPAYLAEYCRQAGTRRPGMRSAGTWTLLTLDVPRTRTVLCDRSFAVAGPHIWNSLPAGTRDPTLSAGTSATLLKTYLFECLFNGRGAGVFELAPQKCTL